MNILRGNKDLPLTKKDATLLKPGSGDYRTLRRGDIVKILCAPDDLPWFKERRGRIAKVLEPARLDKDGNISVKIEVAGEEATVSGSCLELGMRSATPDSKIDVKIGDCVRLLEPLSEVEWFTVTRILDGGLTVAIQNRASTKESVVPPSALCRADEHSCCDKPKMSTILHDYQQTIVDFFVQHPVAIGVLPIGCGKTIVALSLYLRLRYGANQQMSDGDLFIIVTEAKLVDDVWIRQWRAHGVHGRIVTGRAPPPDDAVAVVMSYNLLLACMAESPMRTRTLWGRPIGLVVFDEIQNVRNGDCEAHWSMAASLLCKSSRRVCSLTGTPITTNERQFHQIFKTIGVETELQRWHEDSEGQVRQVHKMGHLIWKKPEDLPASLIPASHPPQHVTYESKWSQGFSMISTSKAAVAECLGEYDAQLLEHFMGLSDRERASEVRERLESNLMSSKMKAFVKVVNDLISGQFSSTIHVKIVVSVFFKPSICILQEVIRAKLPRVAMANVIPYHGEMTRDDRSRSLGKFLENTMRAVSILLVSVSAGATGLNMTNGARSPTAHIEFEQGKSVTERMQMQGRIRRQGNPLVTQLVVMRGEGTLQNWVLKRHEVHATVQADAGFTECQDMLDWSG